MGDEPGALGNRLVLNRVRNHCSSCPALQESAGRCTMGREGEENIPASGSCSQKCPALESAVSLPSKQPHITGIIHAQCL